MLVKYFFKVELPDFNYVLVSFFFIFMETKPLVIGRAFPFLVRKEKVEGTLILNAFSTLAVIVHVSIILFAHFAIIVASPRTRNPLKLPVCHTSGSAGSDTILTIMTLVSVQ